MLDPEHPTQLVAVALLGPRGQRRARHDGNFAFSHGEHHYTLDPAHEGEEPVDFPTMFGATHRHVGPDWMLRELHQENWRSFKFRYDGTAGKRPPTPTPPKMWVPAMDTVEAIKSCHCYRYQSCEHPTWPDSIAHAFIEQLVDTLAHQLEGYDDAPWGWDQITSANRLANP
jgi:hypothetical protein